MYRLSQMSAAAHPNASGFLSLVDAANLLPHRPHPTALWRWARRGLRARDGRLIRLAHVRLGGRVYVTREAIEEFGRRLAEADMVAFDANRGADSEGGP